MVIGIHDEDFFKHIIMPNLEVMKLCSYWRKHNTIIKLCKDIRPEGFSNFIIHKDYYDGEFDKEITQYDNIQTSGMAFTNGVYIPMAEDIEIIVPSTTIYLPYEQFYNPKNNARRLKEFKMLCNARHLRLSLDGKTIWNKYEKQLVNDSSMVTMFHDTHISQIIDAPLAINDTLKSLKRTNKWCSFKYPLEFSTFNSFEPWSELPYGKYAQFILHDFSTEEIVALPPFFESNKHLSFHPFFIDIGIYGNAENFFKNGIEIFKQALFLCTHNGQALLTYNRGFAKTHEQASLLQLLNAFLKHRGTKKTDYTVVSYSKNCLRDYRPGSTLDWTLTHNLPSTDLRPTLFAAREGCRYLYTVNQDFFNLLYTCNKVEFIGGELCALSV